MCLYKSNYFVGTESLERMSVYVYEDTHGGTNDGGKHFNFINHPVVWLCNLCDKRTHGGFTMRLLCQPTKSA